MKGAPDASGESSAATAEGEGAAAESEYLATLTVPNRIESVRPAAAFIVHTARALSVGAANAPVFEVAVTEALTNSVKHGHGGSRSEIRCEVELSHAQFTVRIFDAGPGFNVPPRRTPSPGREVLHESGYGLPIMQSVFPVVRGVRVNERFGLELTLPLQ